MFRRILNYALVLFFFLSAICFVLGVVCGGILTDFEQALEKVQELERQNLLNNPPDTISNIAHREIELLHDSAEIREYISVTEERYDKIEYLLFLFMKAWFLLLVLRIFCAKRYNK